MRKSFFVKLAFLILPILIIASIPLTKESHQSIGGGGYDLTNLYCGFFILLAIIAWILFILIHSVIFRKNRNALNDNLKLVGIGFGILFIASLILFNTWIT
ncbi:hypothetical protein [Flavobacterium microcysteis]|uniref:Uncharacterized protein n=1 Tax=Flavobacterium microcysteis TaxID=2596891 RepID=A0A501QC95_9FLAO|nr:hypothetical protein [Flavobacterium microcysteis]TPD70479.1 hypothetical protein FJA49_05950 [Flavobacterium microcysteis]